MCPRQTFFFIIDNVFCSMIEIYILVKKETKYQFSLSLDGIFVFLFFVTNEVKKES